MVSILANILFFIYPRFMFSILSLPRYAPQQHFVVASLCLLAVAAIAHVYLHLSPLFLTGCATVLLNQYICAYFCFSEQRSGYIKRSWNKILMAKCINYCLYALMPVLLCQNNSHWFDYIIGCTSGLIIYNLCWLYSLRS